MKMTKVCLRRVESKAKNNDHDINVANRFSAYVNSFIKVLLIPMINVISVHEKNDPFELKSL